MLANFNWCSFTTVFIAYMLRFFTFKYICWNFLQCASKKYRHLILLANCFVFPCYEIDSTHIFRWLSIGHQSEMMEPCFFHSHKYRRNNSDFLRLNIAKHCTESSICCFLSIERSRGTHFTQSFRIPKSQHSLWYL